MNKGVTLPELLITMGIATILFAIGGVAFANLHSESQLDLFASEVKNVMHKAQARSLNNVPSGVYFESGRFAYFEGATFIEGNPLNEVVLLPGGLSISAINFSGSILRFVPVSGYVDGFTLPSNVIITESGTGKTRTIAVNELGVVKVQ